MCTSAGRLTDPLAYARRTVINATRDDWRRSMRAERARREVARFPSTDAHDPQERLVTNSALTDALDELPHGQRAVIVLRYGSQLSEAETAAALGITTGTVKSQKRRGPIGPKFGSLTESNPRTAAGPRPSQPVYRDCSKPSTPAAGMPRV